jgi:NO-binding membrane sensor protein with MHYT domain
MSNDWYDEAYDRMIEYISETSGLSIGQVRDVYAVMHYLGLIDYDTEKEVIWDQFCD